MKFNKLFAASLSLALNASAVSAQRRRLGLRGIASSVLLEDSSSSGSDSRDSNSQDGLRRDMKTWGSADSSADSNSNSNSSDEPDYYYENLYATNFYDEMDMFIAAGNSNSNKGYCTGRGWNTCDNRRPDCRWIGNQRDGYCIDDNRNNNNNNNNSKNNNNNNNDVDPFNNGLNEGRRIAQNLWRNMGNSCSNAWSSFSDRINSEIRNRGWNSTSGNWRTQSFNQGARAGMQQVLKEKEKQCFNNSPDECIDLGNEAARIIAFRHCNPDLLSTNSHKNYKATCRKVAIGQCQGQIFTQVSKIRGCGSRSTNKTRQLQNECTSQVNSMIGYGTKEMSFMED